MYHLTDELQVRDRVDALHRAADQRRLVAEARRAAAALGVPVDERRGVPAWLRLPAMLRRVRPRWT